MNRWQHWLSFSARIYPRTQVDQCGWKASVVTERDSAEATVCRPLVSAGGRDSINVVAYQSTGKHTLASPRQSAGPTDQRVGCKCDVVDSISRPRNPGRRKSRQINQTKPPFRSKSKQRHRRGLGKTSVMKWEAGEADSEKQ